MKNIINYIDKKHIYIMVTVMIVFFIGIAIVYRTMNKGTETSEAMQMQCKCNANHRKAIMLQIIKHFR